MAHSGFQLAGASLCESTATPFLYSLGSSPRALLSGLRYFQVLGSELGRQD